MSGRDWMYTTISTEELRNLRSQAQRATSLSMDLTSLQNSNRRLQERNAILDRWNNTNQNALRDQESRIETLNDNIARLNSRIAEQEVATTKETQILRTQLQQTLEESNRRIQEEARKNELQIQEMQQNFSAELTQAKSDLLDTINSNNEKIEDEMKNLESRIEEQMDSINSELNGVESRLDSVEASVDKTEKDNNIMLEMAQEYERNAQIILEEIQTNHRTDLLPKGRIKPVLDVTASCEKEIRDALKMSGNSATARREARKAYEEVQRLYQDVVKAEQEWELHLGLARQVVGAATAQLEASKIIELSEEDNILVDVNHWTMGDLSDLQVRLESLEKQLNAPEELQKLLLADLDGIKDAGVQISHEIEETSFFGLAAFYASQDRADIAQDIADQLGRHGLTIVDYSYQGNDQRAAHRLHLRNNTTKFEIVITQTPETKDDGTIANKLESDIIKYGNLNAERGCELAREILSSLSGLGFENEEIHTVKGFESKPSDRTEHTNINQWRTETATEVAKPKHIAQPIL